ncbi:hypothetical protein ACWDZ4_16510 [Streptomyces sp. NPDC003016]
MRGLPGDTGDSGQVPALVDTLADIWADAHPELIDTLNAATDGLSVPALRRQITGHPTYEGFILVCAYAAGRTGSSHPGDRMRTHLAATLGSVVLTAGTLLGAPAAGAQTAAYPITPFDVALGASYVRGTLTWYDRSVGADGTLRAVGCNRAWFGAYGASGNELGSWNTGIKCDVTYRFRIGIPADAPGGAAYVRVCMDDASTNPPKCVRYNRP